MGIRAQVLTLLASIVLIVIAYSLASPHFKYVFILAVLFGVLAATYDFSSAKTGYINLGYTFVIGVAGYIGALLASNIWIALFLSAVGGFIAGVIMWALTLKLRGPYFAVATMVLPLLLIYLARSAYPIFKGDDGISLWNHSQQLPDALVLALAIATMAILALLNMSRIGRLADAIAMDEMLVPFYGIDIRWVKFIISAIGCTLAGLASFMLVAKQGLMSTAVIEPIPYIVYLILASGIRPGSFAMAFLAGFFIYILDVYLATTLFQAKMLITGGLLVIVYYIIWRRYARS
ncbi:ABC-type branched-chain amino acid transport system, permease component [Pyrobaculum oguniense TE7]|uniref:ABC-type branched-chain amino acid transport system, permease component n=1 Tax=Pyrobaculum oguniense (strain DSM 13380 / JCM 10595 / TE7) TaxID=698757 RepID=H6Q911_PYROT|nr:ABC-type branched-chain amino acid transport system, permease component [Pyrobaculum oguniense TE7]